MKRALLTAALLLTAGAAAAMNSPTELTKIQMHQLRQYAPHLDVQSLTADQVRAIASALNSNERNEIGYQIRSILN